MTSRHLVERELAPILDVIPHMGVSSATLAATRQRVDTMTQLCLADVDDTVAVNEHLAPGFAGGPPVRVRLYTHAGLRHPAPVVYQIHGGGFLFGTAEMGDPRNRQLAKALGAALVSIEYRLSPEHPYPAALDDCYAVLLWLHSQGPSLGLDPTRVALRGESAGGGLATALSLKAHGQGGPGILFQLLVSPMLDDRTCTVKEPNPYTGEFIWDRQSNHFGWSSWLGRPAGSANVPHLAAPARASDLSGLPPTMIATGALDLFVDENIEFTKRLIRAGVPTELYVAAGAFHGFEVLAPDAEVSRAFMEHCETSLRRAFRVG